MKLFKSPWIYTAIAAFVFLATPVGNFIGHFTDGFGQKIGANNGKQLAFLLAVFLFIPITVVDFLSKKILR